MISCIANEHADFPAVFKLSVDLFGIMDNANLSKCLEWVYKWRILLEKLAKGDSLPFLMVVFSIFIAFGPQAFAKVFVCPN